MKSRHEGRFVHGEAKDAGWPVYTLKDTKSGISFSYGPRHDSWYATIRWLPGLVNTVRQPSREACEKWINDLIKAWNAIARHEKGAAERFNAIAYGKE